MNFITPLFFEFEPLKIANVTENGSGRLEVARFIGQYEKLCLREVLGDSLAKELNDSYEIVSGEFVLKSDATQPIKDLVNGLEYDAPVTSGSFYDPFFDASGLDIYWGGETGVIGGKRIWSGIVRSEEFYNGVELSTFKTSFIADYIHYHFLLVNRSTTTGTGQQVLAGENSQTVSNFSKRIDSWNSFCFKISSLYMFLQDNRVNYPTWKPNSNIRFKEKY